MEHCLSFVPVFVGSLGGETFQDSRDIHVLNVFINIVMGSYISEFATCLVLIIGSETEEGTLQFEKVLLLLLDDERHVLALVEVVQHLYDQFVDEQQHRRDLP